MPRPVVHGPAERVPDRPDDLGLLPLVPTIQGGARGASLLLPFIELDHVSIRVSDVRRSARFYMELFGSEASRDLNRQANPGSRAGELWFIRLGRSHLALAPTSSSEPAGVDHYCLSVSAFSKEAAKASLRTVRTAVSRVAIEQRLAQGPDGLLIQLAPSANQPQVPTIVRNPVVVRRGADLPAVPPLRALRISRLVLATAQLAESEHYYSRLLGDARSSSDSRSFPVGPGRDHHRCWRSVASNRAGRVQPDGGAQDAVVARRHAGESRRSGSHRGA